MRAPMVSAWRVSTALVITTVASVAGCGVHGHERAGPAESSSPAPPAPPAPATAAPQPEPPRALTPARAPCETALVFAGGAAAGSICVDDASTHGLTVVDLSDDWTPAVFARDAATGDASPYRAKYLRLANQKNADLGLLGVAPSLSLHAERLADDERQACQAAIDRAPLAALHARLLAVDEREAAAIVKRPEARAAVAAAQAQLVCDRLLSRARASGLLGASTQIALDAFRRRHMIVSSGTLDADSVGALSLPGEDLDLRALLRGLRERVAEATGLIEDGSAAGEPALVAGRALDFSRFGALGAPAALEGAAPDLVGTSTDAAARELGWTSAASARAFVAARGPGGLRDLRVAVKLPAPPPYHGPSMELRAEIDRGDVFYETPVRAALARRRLGTARAPSFVLYAKVGDAERPLVRWPTTIGGWQKERLEEGEVVLKYKESDVGDRLWRHLVAAPAWLPPDSTPEADLLREGDDGSHALKRDLIEPGYRNAYGLLMLMHEEPVVRGDDTELLDHGIRTHGSVNYKSIVRGQSHGCHRLYNHLALRLGGYLLAHRRHVRRGKMHSNFHRTLEWEGQTIEVHVPTRGYLYELDPPVPVRVLEGRVAGEVQTPNTRLIRVKTDPAPGG